jgi:hypothetical protein
MNQTWRREGRNAFARARSAEREVCAAALQFKGELTSEERADHLINAALAAEDRPF